MKYIRNITCIGGSDGPTSIFLAGKTGNVNYVMLAAGLILLAAGIYMIMKKRIPFLNQSGEDARRAYAGPAGFGAAAGGVILTVGSLLGGLPVLLLPVGILAGVLAFALAKKYF